jgi:hypothetical protein
MGNGLRIGQVIDADNLNIGKERIFAQCPKDISPNTTKSVDTHFNGHDTSLLK